MRSIGAGFGLVAFMIAIAISLWMWATYTKEVAHYGSQATKQAQRYSGHDENGRAAIKSVTLSPEEQNGRLKYVMVDAIDPQGAYAKWFHLQQNDAIIAVGPIDLKDQDWEMAHALVAEAYQREQELIVMRGGVKMALPEGRVLDDPTALANQVTVAPTPSTQPIKAAQDDRTVPKELGPLRGVIR
jgi:hypothetical protein